jgi:methylmalonyl-CoA epimerase
MPRVIRINHIGLASADLERTLSVLSGGMGLEVAGSEVVPGDAVKVTFLPIGESRIEVLEPVGEEGPVQKFLANRGPGFHHMCIEVEDLSGMLARLRENGVELIDNEPRPGAHGSMVAFIHPKAANGVMIELVESSSLKRAEGS